MAGGKKGPTDRYYPASWLTRVQKDGYLLHGNSLHRAFYPAVGLDRKKKKTIGVVVDRGEAPTREPKKGGNDSGRG